MVHIGYEVSHHCKLVFFLQCLLHTHIPKKAFTNCVAECIHQIVIHIKITGFTWYFHLKKNDCYIHKWNYMIGNFDDFTCKVTNCVVVNFPWLKTCRLNMNWLIYKNYINKIFSWFMVVCFEKTRTQLRLCACSINIRYKNRFGTKSSLIELSRSLDPRHNNMIILLTNNLKIWCKFLFY